MKILVLIFGAGLTLTLSSCAKSHASGSHPSEVAPTNGAQFKEGKGVSLTDTMSKAIELQTAEVSEEDITPMVSLQLQTTQSGTEAVGWLSPDQAKHVKPGAKLNLSIKTPKLQNLEGTVSTVQKETAISSGEYEVSVKTNEHLDAGLLISATIHLEEAKGLTVVPKSALLATAEGNFVYAKNGDFYVRTPVKLGAVGGNHIEVTDGLYSGDEIVTSPVMSLWLAELQVLRGGKACTCGH